MDSYFSDEQTLTLLKLVHTQDMQDKFNANKKKHRKVWDEISKILELQGIKKSAAKCQNRYENTKRSYNTIKRNHTGPQKPNYAYWDFWESILGEKRDEPFDGFDEHHDMYVRLKESVVNDGLDGVPDWELWTKYEEYYRRKESMAAEPENANLTPIFTDRETDELLLIMGKPATRQIFIKHRKKHRIAWNYILKSLKKKGIHKTADKVKNRFENLKRKYMHYKKNFSPNEPPDWRYWNVFEEYMAIRPNPTESVFMADDGEPSTTEADDCAEDMEEIAISETDFEEIRNEIEKFDDAPFSTIKKALKTSDNPIEEENRSNEKFCRICLQSDGLTKSETIFSVFDPLNSNIRINEALAVCVGLEVFQEQDSSIGNEICQKCVKQLQATYNFRKLCWASQYELTTNRNQCPPDDCKVESCRRVLRSRHKKTETIESSTNQSRIEINATAESGGSSPRFETFYEFVDTDPVPESDHDDGEPRNLDDITKRASDRAEKLKNFKCSICMKKFPNIEYIKKHLVKMHALIPDSQNFKNYLELSNYDSDDEIDDNVKCYICGKSYVKREYLKKHLKLIHNITDSDYNVYERIDEENKTKKPLLCHSCGESFVLKHIFKKHIEHHERGSLLSCDYCDIKLVDKPALQRHMVLHTGQRNHKCIFCAKGFFTRISRKRHERNVHTKEKSHICQYCDKKFVMWKFLERHLNTHTAEVVYECDQCDKKYLNKNHLRVHKFRHEKEPPFKCSICSKAYFDRSTLKKHNYVHVGNPYQCTTCDRTFDRRDKMNNHMQKVHGVEKLNENQVSVDESLS